MAYCFNLIWMNCGDIFSRCVWQPLALQQLQRGWDPGRLDPSTQGACISSLHPHIEAEQRQDRADGAKLDSIERCCVKSTELLAAAVEAVVSPVSCSLDLVKKAFSFFVCAPDPDSAS